MMTVRALTLLVTSILALGSDGVGHPDGNEAGHIFGATAQRTVSALLAEALELCEGAQDNPVPRKGTAARVARMAAGREALAISIEVAKRAGDRDHQRTVSQTAAAIRKSCLSEGGSSADRTDEARSWAATDRLFALAAVGDRERSALVAPFVGRLGDAATLAVASRRVSAAEGDDLLVAETAMPTPAQAGERVTDLGETAVHAGPAKTEPTEPAASPARGSEAAEPVIIMEMGATERHQQRVAEWGPVFRSNAGLLRVARGALQREIEAYSMAEARRVCRSFGHALDRLDPRLGRVAPSRELSLRVGRMLASYRRGASECLSGRAAAAYSYLSEGDREWSALARAAARVLEPRPARVLR